MLTNPKFWIVIAIVFIVLPFVLLKILAFTAEMPERSSELVVLPACPDSPNCVCSEDSREGKMIVPLSYEGEPAAAWSRLRAVLAEAGGKEVQSSEGYLWLEFRTPLIGFVDDVEFRLNPEKNQIEVRSASRVGHSDMGANRRRVEVIRAAFRQVT